MDGFPPRAHNRGGDQSRSENTVSSWIDDTMSMGRLLDDRRFRLWIHSSRGSIERTLDWDELHEPQNVHRWRCLDGNQPGSLAHSRKTSVGPDYNRRVDIVQPIGTHVPNAANTSILVNQRFHFRTKPQVKLWILTRLACQELYMETSSSGDQSRTA